MHSQQNSEPQTEHVMWLHEPSSILMMKALQRGHGLMSPVGGQHRSANRRDARNTRVKDTTVQSSSNLFSVRSTFEQQIF